MKLFALTTLGLGLVLFGSYRVAAGSGQGDLIPLRISVFNNSPISPNTIQSAEGEASRVLREVGVRVIWLNCFKDTQCAETSSALHFDLRIVRSSRNLKASAVGISFFADDGQGCCADLFYEPIQKLREETDASPSLILGYAMAHELGHLLLGTNSHSPSGLMRAHWTCEDLKNASQGRLWFSSEQSVRIRSRLTAPEPQKMQTINIAAELAGVEESKLSNQQE